jgi:hypothetical protein
VFNELTLSLHILLLVSIYLFLFVVVKTIAKDVAVSKSNQPDSEIEDEPGVDPERIEEEYPKILLINAGTNEPGVAYTIYDELLIGRAPDCDIVLDDSFVSSHHARVYRVEPDYWLEDLGSTNGTLIEQSRVNVPIRLTHNSEFIISDSIFRFVE